jgi:hypothetical protein
MRMAQQFNLLLVFGPSSKIDMDVMKQQYFGRAPSLENPTRYERRM